MGIHPLTLMCVCTPAHVCTRALPPRGGQQRLCLVRLDVTHSTLSITLHHLADHALQDTMLLNDAFSHHAAE